MGYVTVPLVRINLNNLKKVFFSYLSALSKFEEWLDVVLYNSDSHGLPNGLIELSVSSKYYNPSPYAIFEKKYRPSLNPPLLSNSCSKQFFWQTFRLLVIGKSYSLGKTGSDHYRRLPNGAYKWTYPVSRNILNFVLNIVPPDSSFCILTKTPRLFNP